MSLKILLGKLVAFFARHIPVEGHKNIINSFQKLIISPKRFIGAHGGIKSQSARIVNTNHGIIVAVELRVLDCIRACSYHNRANGSTSLIRSTFSTFNLCACTCARDAEYCLRLLFVEYRLDSDRTSFGRRDHAGFAIGRDHNSTCERNLSIFLNR